MMPLLATISGSYRDSYYMFEFPNPLIDQNDDGDVDVSDPVRILLRLFAGGPLGSGRQVMSWIHRDDWVSLAKWAIETPAARGPLNLTAPNPVTNADFARALGRALDRPAILPAPGLALKVILGEMAGPLLLYSQRVVPARATSGGFSFAHPELDGALADLLGKKT